MLFALVGLGLAEITKNPSSSLVVGLGLAETNNGSMIGPCIHHRISFTLLPQQLSLGL